MSWPTRQLREFFNIKHGYAFKSEYFADAGEYVLLTPGNFREEGGFRDRKDKEKFYVGTIPDDYLLKQGDLLVAMTEQAPGLLGSAILVPESNRYLHNQRLGLVGGLDGDHLNKGFLYHLFNSRDVRLQIHTGAGGTKVRHTSPEKILAVKFLCPPLNVQIKIAEVLSTWDTAIADTEKLIVINADRKQGLMQQLLLGKRRFQEFVKRTGMFETQFGSFPNDWDFVRVGDSAREISKRNINGRALTVLSCTKHRGLVDSLSYFGKRIFSENTSTYKIVRRGQFAYATNHIEEGSIGYQDLYDEALISPMYTVFETTGQVDHSFFYKLLKTELYRHIFEVNTSGSIDRRGALRWNDFANIRVALPSLEEQRRIAEVLSASDKEIELLKRQLDALKRQKRGLMQKLLTGQIRVNVDDIETAAVEAG